MSVHVPTLACPNRGERIYTDSSGEHALSDYAAFVMNKQIIGELATVGIAVRYSPPGDDFGWTGAENWNEQRDRYRGVISKGGNFFDGAVRKRYGKISYASIKDGSSNTMLYGEKAARTDHYNSEQGEWWDTKGYMYPEWSTMRAWHTDAKQLVADGDHSNFNHRGMFGSSHPGLVNFVLADGSVKSINIGVGVANFFKFAAKDDGSVIDTANF
jgi:prepilin-type processing-associated H-X9-DG protein